MKLFGRWQKESESAKKRAEEQPAFEHPPETRAAPRQDDPLGKNRKILIVDDNPVVLKAFELKLVALGFQVVTASDGPTAVNVARNEMPDLIVLDINFPPEVGSSGLQWDGFSILQWMHRFQEASNIPVIIITSEEHAKFKSKALSAGAVAFFQKPINHEEFLKAVRRTLGQTSVKEEKP